MKGEITEKTAKEKHAEALVKDVTADFEARREMRRSLERGQMERTSALRRCPQTEISQVLLGADRPKDSFERGSKSRLEKA